MISSKKQSVISVFFFLLAIGLGVFLRLLYVFDVPVTYRNIVHAHSHIALLGWVYVCVTTILYSQFLRKEKFYQKYRNIFWFTQITLLGMLVTFPIQGYGLFSIIFSTLFLFASYGFTWFFIRNIPQNRKNTNSYKCVKTALFYMVISSIGPWALGIIMNTLGTGSAWYRIAIYFYLHFQYNGWMMLVLFGLLFFALETIRIKISDKDFNWFFIFFNLGIIFTFFLSVLWTKPSIIYYLLSGLGGTLQFMALIVFLTIVKKYKKELHNLFLPFQVQVMKTIGILILIKFVLQLLSAFPYFANLAAAIVEFTIGYLHWTFLGVVSIGLFLFLDFFKLIKIHPKAYYIYVLGFLLTETLIFYKGVVSWLGISSFNKYYLILSIASILIFVGVLLILVNSLKPTRSN